MPASLIRRVSQAMSDADWKHTMDEEKGLILCFLSTEVAMFGIQMAVHEAEERVILSISFERRCPKKKRVELAALCNQFNWQNQFGFFGVNFSDGEVKCRNGVCVQGIDVTPKFVDNLLRQTIEPVKKGYVICQQAMCKRPCPPASEVTPINPVLELLRILAA
jgi:hypothetical protein